MCNFETMLTLININITEELARSLFGEGGFQAFLLNSQQCCSNLFRLTD